MDLYPPNSVQGAFADLAESHGLERWSISEAGNREWSLSLNWHFDLRRWFALAYDFDRGAYEFAFFCCKNADCPNCG